METELVKPLLTVKEVQRHVKYLKSFEKIRGIFKDTPKWNVVIFGRKLQFFVFII